MKREQYGKYCDDDLEFKYQVWKTLGYNIEQQNKMTVYHRYIELDFAKRFSEEIRTAIDSKRIVILPRGLFGVTV